MVEPEIPEEGEKVGEEEGEEGEAEEETVTIIKPKMKIFSGKTAAGVRIRAEPSFLVSLTHFLARLIPQFIRFD